MLLLWLSAGVFAVFLFLPVLAILIRVLTTGGVLQTLGRPVVWHALQLSLFTTLVTLAITLVFGTPLAWVLARHDFRGRALVDSLIEMPMVLPPAVAGIGLLLAFGRRGLLGPSLESVGVTIGFTTMAVILAQTFVAAPFYVRAARTAFLTIDRELEIVAHTLGVSEWATFWRVTVPVTLPVLLSGAVMSWARALGEFGATLMFAGSFEGRTQTMPLAIYAALESDFNATLVLSMILVVFSFGLLLLLRLGIRRLHGGELA